jgi:hypothetical protein
MQQANATKRKGRKTRNSRKPESGFRVALVHKLGHESYEFRKIDRPCLVDIYSANHLQLSVKLSQRKQTRKSPHAIQLR